MWNKKRIYFEIRELFFFGKGRIRTYVEIFQQIYSLPLLTTQPLSLNFWKVSKKNLYLYKIQSQAQSVCLLYRIKRNFFSL